MLSNRCFACRLTLQGSTLWAVPGCAACSHTVLQCSVSLNMAVNMTRQKQNTKQVVHDSKAQRVSKCQRFIKYQLCKWFEQGGVQNRPHRKPKLKLEDEVVMQFAYKLSMGYPQHNSAVAIGQLVNFWWHRNYRSLNDAAQNNVYIQHIQYSNHAAFLHEITRITFSSMFN